MENGFVPIPRELDTKPKFFLWDFDVAALFMAGFSLGIFVGSLTLGILSGLALARLWAKLSQGQARGFGIHTLYWHLPGRPFACLPPSHQREFLG